MSEGNDPPPAATADARASAASALARRLIEGVAEVPNSLGSDERRALAWALKDACYAAWSSEPRRAALSAAVLARLSAVTARTDPTAREVAALAAWTEGIAQVTHGHMTEAIANFDTAAAEFLALGQGAHAAETQVPKIMPLAMLGRHAEATDCAESARKELLAAGDLRAAAKLGLNLGSLQMRQDSYDKAARHYREAVVLFARVGDMEHSVMADIGLADALTATGEFEEAQHAYARAGMRAEARGFPVLAAVVDESVGLLQLVRGRYREALAGLESSRRRYEALALPQHLAVAEKQLADAYLELRLLPEALALYEQALRKFETLDMPQEHAWTLVQVGRCRALLGQAAASADVLARASSLFADLDSRLGGAAVDLAMAELATAAADHGEALRLASRAARRFAAAGLADGKARAHVLRAHALLELGRAEPARRLLARTLAQARQRELLPVQVRCLAGQGLMAVAAGRRGAARKAFSTAVDLFEDQRRALPGDEIRSAFLTDHLVPYRELLRLSLDAQARSDTPASAELVLLDLERFRARSWADRLAQPDDVLGREDHEQLRGRVNWLYRRLRRAQDEGAPTSALLEELRNTERELLEQVRRNRLTNAAPLDRSGDSGPFSSGQLIEALGPDAALVEYGVADDELFACVVAGGHVRVRRALARWSDVLKTAQSARFQIETLRFGSSPVARHAESLARRAELRMQQLHAQLWAPLQEDLGAYRRVLIVPHAQLASLPFAALHDGRRYLAEAVELATAPSARIALHGLHRTMRVPKRALAIGDSITLVHAGDEARFVAGLFPEADALSGSGATIAALQAAASEADVIHLACHAQFRVDNPRFSALHLSDGALTVEAVERLKLRPGIVVLSACETALAESGTGDEMVGLVRAFLLAGAARVVASLWPVEDAATAAFMSGFYAALREGRSPASALALAQRAALQRNAHPFFWSGFSLYGGH